MCPGSGQRPTGEVRGADSTRPAGTVIRPEPPAEPAGGRSCDGGGCNSPSVGWRLYRGWRHWLPVCGLHMDGPAGPTRIHDPEEKS
ncbi:hypothetical protein GCM10010193_69580 [Kitasatospora atroaurantiaca]